MTFEQLKEKLRGSQTSDHNSNACGYSGNSDGPIDPWDDEDEAAWLAGYSQYHPAAKTVLAEQLKQEEKVVTEEEKEEMDHFWQALIILAECRGAIEKLLQLDTRKDFLSPTHHKDLTDLLSNVEDLVDQYDFKELHE